MLTKEIFLSSISVNFSGLARQKKNINCFCFPFFFLYSFFSSRDTRYAIRDTNIKHSR